MTYPVDSAIQPLKFKTGAWLCNANHPATVPAYLHALHVCINSKVSFQVIPAVLEAIKDAEYEGTYIRPVSIQLCNYYF